MSRLLLRSAGLFVGLIVVVASSAEWGLTRGAAQQPDPKKTDPKKTDAKQPDPKKDAKQPDPKKPDPKTPAPKKPDPKTPDPKTPAPQPPAAQPPEPPLPLADGPPNSLDLVRGLREQGMADLGLEYLQDLDKKPGVPAAVKDEIPLERAKCQLDAADDEPDEGTRITLVNEAKEGFHTFLKNAPTHRRAPEAHLALARLSSLEAKAQLTRSRRVDVPAAGQGADEDRAREEAVKKAKQEAAAARPLFRTAAAEFKNASKLIDAQLEKNPDPAARRSLVQLQYEAELARGTNQFALADTFPYASNEETKERSDLIDEAQNIFNALAQRAGAPPRVTGVARAWMAECEFEKKDLKAAEDEFKRIENSTGPDAEDAKRMGRFFALRHAYLEAVGARTGPALDAVEQQIRKWLQLYGSLRRAQGETVAAKWYLAYTLQLHADLIVGPKPKTPPPKPTPITGLARAKYQEAEKLYRTISQSDNEYSTRAAKQRMIVVHHLLGEADRPAAEYKTFEECQMASLIQMSRVMDLDKDREKNLEDIKKRQLVIVALLERARQLATEKDNPADVTDVLLRLIRAYKDTNQPFQAAILGEHVARTVKSTGGKSAVAGGLALVGYAESVAQLRLTDADKLDAARKSDRERAIRLARFLDEKLPNDTATDYARYRLASLLYEDGKPVEAYDALLRVRPGYEQIAQTRLFQAALVSQLLAAKTDSPLPTERRRDVFRRTTADLDKVGRPRPEAPEGEVRAYLTARCRLALLYLMQSRVDPEGDKLDPGYLKARKIADEALGLVAAFDTLVKNEGGTKAPNLDGWEMKLLAEDARTKAILLEGQTLFAEKRYDDAYKVIGDVLAEMNKDGPYAEAVKKLSGAAMPAKKDPPPKAADPAPKKDGGPKKEPEPKKEPADEMADDLNAAVKSRLTKLADSVDKYRRDLIVLALKIRVKQGQAEKGAEQIELLKKFGGSIEANVGTLELVTAEMAGQIMALRREGRADEAKALTDGFAKLLDRVSAEPNLPPSVQRFLGQSLILVGEYEKAIDLLKKVPAPADRGALAKPNEIPDPQLKKQVLEYRRATLELIRAYRLGEKFPEADALLKASMGTPDKPDWASNSIDFRREVAYLSEARGAAANGPPANKLWGEALKEWTAQYTIYRRLLEQGPPKGPNGQPDNARFLTTKNSYFEAFFNVQRCLVKANRHLLKDPKFAPKLQKTYDDVGKKFADLEKVSGQDITPEVREKYYDLLAEIPELKKAYEGAGGKLFLEKP
ncbi:MAG: hypothetical protein JWO38_73 [Gemmataceae bacterium]|nr:hypothetical protein [Gemmataceae bacterium]